MTTPRAASLGNISLAAAIAGLLATELALRHGVVAGAVWQVIRQAVTSMQKQYGPECKMLHEEIDERQKRLEIR